MSKTTKIREVSMPFRAYAPFLPVLERIEWVNAYLSINALSGLYSISTPAMYSYYDLYDSSINALSD